jgi:hypothetical protein
MHRFNKPDEQQVVPPEYNERSRPFTVAAGKIEHDERGGISKNYKYVDQFASLEEALFARDQCEGYHFVELTYTDVDGRVWDIALEPHSA